MFSEIQWKTLEALCNRIIPPDDYPGAWEAGVGSYLSRLLENEEIAHQTTYRQGLDALEAEAMARFGTPFAALYESLQDELLFAIQSGSVRIQWPVSPQGFFSLVVQHTAEGYYSDPANGGNRDAISWRMIGFV